MPGNSGERRDTQDATRNAQRTWPLLIPLLMLLLAFSIPDEVHPTPWWVDFMAQQSTLDGKPLPVGAVVRAYDPSGVLAGETTVALPGWYLVSVYGDDPQTPDLDEGAGAGDPIAFTVDGYPAVPLGPDAPLWTASGGRLHVELRACTLHGDFDCNCHVTVADLMRQAAAFGVARGQPGYYPPLDRNGDGRIDAADLQATAGQWRGTCQEPQGGVRGAKQSLKTLSPSGANSRAGRMGRTGGDHLYRP